MSTWKCILCGTTIMSKCPSQRSEFYGPEIAVIRSAVTVDRVDYHGTRLNGLSELFVSYTAGADKTTAEQFRRLAEALSKDGILEAMTCSHYFVLNSETEKTCTLDHEHSNLTDAPRLLAEHKASAAEKTLADTLHGLATVACTPISLARKAINCSKDTYDAFVEAEFDQLQHMIRKAVLDLAERKSFRPLYRTMTNGPRSYEGNGVWLYSDGSTEPAYAYFDRLEDAVAMARGTNRRLDIEMLDTEKDAGYRSVDYNLATTCTICSKSNDLEKEVVVRLPEGEAHLACVNHRKRDKEVRPRRTRFSLPRLIDVTQYDLERANELEGVSVDFWRRDDKNQTMVYVAGEMTKADFDDALAVIKRLLTK